MKPKISIFRMQDELNSRKETYKKHWLGTYALDEYNYLSKNGKKEYIILNFTTEKELAWFIYYNSGEGNYMIIAHPLGKGKKPYVFWKGGVDNDGFIFYTQEIHKGVLEVIEKEVFNANTSQEKEFWEKQLNEEREKQKHKTQRKRYGFVPYLLSQGRRGMFYGWNDPILEEPKPIKPKKKFEDMTVDDLNDF